MIKELKKQYYQFADGTMQNFNYTSLTNSKIEITIYCLNLEKDKWELIKIKFIDLVKFRFVKIENFSNDVFMHALIKEENGDIIFDFFPIWWAEDDLEEDPNSRFSIHCKNVEYEVIS